MTFNEAICLLPVAYIAHFLEEVGGFPKWAERFIKKTYSREKFIAENVVLWIMTTTWVVMAVYFPGNVSTVLVLSVAAGFLINVIFHLGFTIRTRVYSPGTISALLFFTPVSLYIYYLAQKEGLLTPLNAALSFVLGAAGLPVVVGVVHKTMDAGRKAK